MNNADFTEFVKDIVCQLINVGARCQRLEQTLRELQTVTVPHWALEFVMDHACFMDERPLPEGWSSPEMNQALNELGKALKK